MMMTKMRSSTTTRGNRRRPTAMISSAVACPATTFMMVFLVAVAAWSVLAFVVVRQQSSSPSSAPRLSSPALFMAGKTSSIDGNDLKSILTSSDYDLGVTETNKGKVVKTAIQNTVSSVSDSTPPATPSSTVVDVVSQPPPPPLPEPTQTVELAKTTTTATPTTTIGDLKASDVTDSLGIPSDLPNKMSEPFDGLNLYLKSVQDSLKTSSSTTLPTTTRGGSGGYVPPSPPPEGKALPLSDFLKAKFTGGTTNPAGNSDVALADSKEKLDLLVTNLKQFVLGLGDTMDNLSAGLQQGGSVSGTTSAPKFWSDATKSIVSTIDTLPDGSAPWIAVGIGAILLAAGTKKDNSKSTSKDTDLASSSAQLGGLTDDLEVLQSRMKALEASGVSLKDELKVAGDKLLQKELEISKERLKALDTASKLNREIAQLQRKLQQNDGKVKSLDDELMKTKSECETLSAELLKAKVDSTEPTTKKSPAAKKAAKKSAKKSVAGKKEAPTVTATTELPSAAATADAEATSTSPPTTKSKKAKKKKTKTKVKKQSVVAEEPEAEEETVTPAPVPSPPPAPPVPSSDDWSTLSKSTLTRKTVKELTGYLEAKGVVTTSEDGKVLKKALLVEAVLSSS